jgi:signal transduction histidine kinase/CheY-like chemotaxis protein
VTAIFVPMLAVAMTFMASEVGSMRVMFGMGVFTLSFPLLRLAAPRLSLQVTGGLYLGLMLVMAVLVELRGGVSTAVTSLELIVIVMAALLFGARGVALGLAACIVGLTAAGIAVVGGYVSPIVPELWNPQYSPVWLRSAAILLAFGGAAATAIVYMVTQLENEARLLQEALIREREQRAALERAEAERERAQRAVAEAERVEALGRLASGVAHDFNNLLTVIVGATEVAQISSQKVPPEVNVCLDDIIRASGQAAELTRSLLMLGRRDIVQPRAIDVKAHVQRMFGTIRRLLPSDIDLAVSIGERACIQSDPTQLDRVLLNLIVNARDAIEREGRVEIGCERLEPGKRPELGEGSYVALWVRDNGRGMDAEVQRHMFEPFFTTKPVGEGTGIGMAMVASFARTAGGDVHVESKPGGGTTVTLYLPESATPVVEDAAVQRTDTQPSRADSHCVLVVEDNTAVRASTVKMLERAGFSVLWAEDGDRALEIVDDARVSLDLLCIDGVLPGARTATVIARARALRPSIAIVVCSGYIDEDLLSRGIQAGEYACVRKPYTAAQLLECVRTELGIAAL